jgi:apolipoprotein N-acyltransferase
MRKVLPKKRTVKKEGTPRFLYLSAFLAFASWSGWAYLLFSTPPDDVITKIFFLGLLFLAFLTTFTFLFYELERIVRPAGLLRDAATKWGRRSLLLAGFVFLAGLMRLLNIANLLNLVLFALIILLTEIQLSRRQKGKAADKEQHPKSAAYKRVQRGAPRIRN